jgi:surface antigen
MLRTTNAVLLSAALLAGALSEGAVAQPLPYGNGYSAPAYADGYRDGYAKGFSDGRNRVGYDDRVPRFAPAPAVSPDDRWRQEYQRPYSYRDDVYYRECRDKVDPGGVIAGALIGGILGNALGRGGGGATIAGVVFGGAMGAALTRRLDCEDRSYAYNTYFEGLNSGRAGVPYQWRNPKNGHYGEFRVDSYYSDRSSFRCANFTQRIYVNGRPEAATGRACQQPDGTWAVVG